MKARVLSAVSIILFLTSCAGLQGERVQFDGLSDCPKQTAVEIVAKRHQLGRLSDSHALECTLAVLRDTEDSAMLRSALGARLSLLLAEREVNPEKREKLAAEGVRFAEAALAHGGDEDAEVHYYLAANLGLAVREHITLAVENLDRLQSEMERALALDPAIDNGGPLRLLGALYLQAPPWPQGIGDLDKALELLEKAVADYPGHPINHLFYAQALWHDGNDASINQARAEFAMGKKLLAEGNWGYSKAAWEKEFAAFAQELIELD